ncbi:MAG: phytoene synthase [Acidiphilium sp. 37-64-53]|uniref:squalene/phytoene synthase family protein n=1 Tax=Acidiphilium TaxID=522 RepID=UPI000BD295B0|nr:MULTISPECIES: squalene/phytoene synthase family protein [Acidiphilium]OYW03795.1 MAG: phytoene synthase [Acidiphilium sp. 37-64-53]OZB28819.1 MAG: phytoene synthase [Acidiphilium sp. 34-64-41]HQT83520.1 squalene/phytoene synthase family protein [Acidiphilium rubrum]
MTDDELAALVRRADPDRFLGAMFAPAPPRRDLLILYAFNHELARAREVASTAPLTLIRLHWWREVVEGAVREHPIARLLRDALDRNAFAPADLIALIDAREAEAEPIPDRPAFMAYVRGTSGRLAALAGGVLGVIDDIEPTTLESIGTGYAIARILATAKSLSQYGRDLLPQDGTDPIALARTATALVSIRLPRAAMPIATLAILARQDLSRLSRGRASNARGIGDRIAVLSGAFIRAFM